MYVPLVQEDEFQTCDASTNIIQDTTVEEFKVISIEEKNSCMLPQKQKLKAKLTTTTKNEYPTNIKLQNVTRLLAHEH